MLIYFIHYVEFYIIFLYLQKLICNGLSYEEAF